MKLKYRVAEAEENLNEDEGLDFPYESKDEANEAARLISLKDPNGVFFAYANETSLEPLPFGVMYKNGKMIEPF